MRIYLDNCCLNRPFDDQRQDRIRLEAEAVLIVLGRIQRTEWTWVGSPVLELEAEKIPDHVRHENIRALLTFQTETIRVTVRQIERAFKLREYGFAQYDALHLAAAEHGRCDVFLTTDDRLQKRALWLGDIMKVEVKNPVAWLHEDTDEK